MSIQSMTGFYFKTFSSKIADYHIEIKSLNGKYSQINFRLQKHFSFLEPKITKIMQKKFNRGKIDVSIRINILDRSFFSYYIDEAGAENFYDALERLRNKLNIIDIIKIADVLGMDDFFLFEIKEESMNKIEEECILYISEASNELIKIREKEGKQILDILSLLISDIEEKTILIEEHSTNFKEYYREKIQKNLSDLLKEVDIEYSQQRLEFELALLAEKADIKEEIDRIKIHLHTMKELLCSEKNDQSVGAKLDFFCQELVREVNTIGSKNKLKEISLLVVEQKSLINSLREQVQNVQ